MFSSHYFHVNAVFQVIYLTRLQCTKVINVTGEREYTRITTPDTWFLGKNIQRKDILGRIRKECFLKAAFR